MKTTIPSLILSFLFFTDTTPTLAEQPANTYCNQQTDAIYNINQSTLSLPLIILDENKDILLEAQLDKLSTVNPFHFRLSTLLKKTEVSALPPTGTYSTSKQLLTLDSLCLHSENGDTPGYHAQIQTIPYSQPVENIGMRAVALD